MNRNAAHQLWLRPTSIALATAFVAASAAAAGFRAAPVADYKEDAWSLGVSAGASFVAGEAREHVFSPASDSLAYANEIGGTPDGRRHQLSRLDWDIAATMIGFSGSARRGRLSLNAGIWYGGSGVDDLDMDDYDWLNGDNVPYSHHSYSEVELTDAWMYDANISFDFWRSEACTGYAFVGVREQRWKWRQDGFTEYWYPEDDGGHSSDHGHGIDYRQVFQMAYVGLGGSWKLSDALSLSAYASWAPRYKGKDRDNHISAEKYFNEKFDYDDGNVYAAGVALDWRVQERLVVFCALDWQKATLHEGDMTMQEYDNPEPQVGKDSAGFESEYAALSFGLKYTF